jgi:hypothetical protein
MTEPFPNICPLCLVLLSHLRGELMARARSCGSINKLYGSALWTSLARASASQLVSRMQPCDSVLLTSAAVAYRKFHNFRPIGRSKPGPLGCSDQVGR